MRAWAFVLLALATHALAQPKALVTSPAPGTQFLAPVSVSITAQANVPATRVEFLANGVLIGAATAAPYNVVWSNAPLGNHLLSVRIVETDGQISLSPPVPIQVTERTGGNVNTPPTVSLTAPAPGTVLTAPANIVLAAEASDTDGSVANVDFFFGDTLITTRTAPPYGFTWTGVPAGTYLLTARVTDNLGASVTSTAVSVTVKQAVAQLYFIHVDHLNTPRLVSNQQGQAVWIWDQQEPFGVNVADTNPLGFGAFEFPTRFPGQYLDKETGLHYNYYRDFDPSLGIYKQSDPIGLRGGMNTYVYSNGDPIALIDPKGLEVEVGVRKFYPIRLPLVRHCFIRFSGSNSNTLAFVPSGVGPDANPAGATYSSTIGPENDSCVRAEMLTCRDYAFFTNNCCDCVAYALAACGLAKVGPWPNYIPAGPFRQPSPSSMCGDQGCPFP